MDVPASVATFVSDGGIRRAVNELLDLGEDEILEGLGWAEIERFYRAKLAAYQVICEWGMFAVDAWNAVWGGLLDHWRPFSPDDQSSNDYDVAVSLSSLRGTDDGSLWFGRAFTKGLWTLYAAVAAIPSVGLRIKVSCHAGNRNVQFEEIAPSSDENENWVPSLTIKLDDGGLDLTQLRALAEQAVAIADRTCDTNLRKTKRSASESEAPVRPSA